MSLGTRLGAGLLLGLSLGITLGAGLRLGMSLGTTLGAGLLLGLSLGITLGAGLLLGAALGRSSTQTLRKRTAPGPESITVTLITLPSSIVTFWIDVTPPGTVGNKSTGYSNTSLPSDFSTSTDHEPLSSVEVTFKSTTPIANTSTAGVSKVKVRLPPDSLGTATTAPPILVGIANTFPSGPPRSNNTAASSLLPLLPLPSATAVTVMPYLLNHSYCTVWLTSSGRFSGVPSKST
jgi:hypothetical protein